MATNITQDPHYKLYKYILTKLKEFQTSTSNGASQAQLDALRSELINKINEVERKIPDTTAQAQDIIDLREQIKNLATKSDLEELKNKLADLTAQLKALEDENSELKKSNDDLTEAYQEAEKYNVAGKQITIPSNYWIYGGDRLSNGFTTWAAQTLSQANITVLGCYKSPRPNWLVYYSDTTGPTDEYYWNYSNEKWAPKNIMWYKCACKLTNHYFDSNSQGYTISNLPYDQIEFRANAGGISPSVGQNLDEAPYIIYVPSVEYSKIDERDPIYPNYTWTIDWNNPIKPTILSTATLNEVEEEPTPIKIYTEEDMIKHESEDKD